MNIQISNGAILPSLTFKTPGLSTCRSGAYRSLSASLPQRKSKWFHFSCGTYIWRNSQGFRNRTRTSKPGVNESENGFFLLSPFLYFSLCPFFLFMFFQLFCLSTFPPLPFYNFSFFSFPLFPWSPFPVPSCPFLFFILFFSSPPLFPCLFRVYKKMTDLLKTWNDQSSRVDGRSACWCWLLITLRESTRLGSCLATSATPLGWLSQSPSPQYSNTGQVTCKTHVNTQLICRIHLVLYQYLVCLTT